MKNILFMFVLTLNLFAYTKSTDTKNVYFESDHFRTVAGIDWVDSTDMEYLSDMILQSAEESWNKVIVEYGFNAPKNTDSKKIDIYIGNKSAYNFETASYETISNSYAGWATYYEDETPYFLLNPIMTSDQFKVTISHEFFHTVQYSYLNYDLMSDDKWYANVWWLEATAVLIEDEVYDDINDYINFLSPFFDATYKSMDIYDGSREYSMVIFAKFIKEKYGFEIIKDSIGMIQLTGTDGFYEILEDLIHNSHNKNMQEVLNEFAIWVSDTSSYFEEGNIYPTIRKYKSTDNITIRKGGIKLVENINEGWNMISLPAGNIESLKIDGQNGIWEYDNGKWKNNISYSNYELISDINSTKGYWLNSKKISSSYYTYYDEFEIDFTNIDNGWTLLSTNKSIDPSILTDYQYIWYYNNDMWYVASNNNFETNNQMLELTKINSHSSFWIYK